MRKIYVFSLLIILALSSSGQNYPYLNASTGNENEFPVDKDTNIYMFHEQRLVKTDKNFNTVWAFKYDSIYFKNILLSKTGSIYFIGTYGTYPTTPRIFFGKINPNGSLNWTKKANHNGYLSFVSLLLDRNDNLVLTGGYITGTSYLLKTDTNGNGLKLVDFGPPQSTNCVGDLSIICDSSGFYKMLGAGMLGISQTGVSLHTFSDNSNTFLPSRGYSVSYPPHQGFGSIPIKSKNPNYFYMMTEVSSNNGTYPRIISKINTSGQVKWHANISSSAFPTYYLFLDHVEDDSKGDVLIKISNYEVAGTHKSALVRIDSNGVVNNSGMVMFNNYPFYFDPNNWNQNTIPKHAPHVIYSGSYYFDAAGYNFPQNPLTIQKFNSSFSFSCSSAITVSNSAFFPGLSNPPAPSGTVISSYALTNLTFSATPVSFSAAQNYCTTVGTTKMNNTASIISLFPNPAYEKIQLELANNQIAVEIEIIDVNGKMIHKTYNNTEIDVKGLSDGMYYLRIKTDKGIFSKKFVKE